MENRKTLLLFTGEFPYGKRGEPFLEDEIWFLAHEFSQIFIFPRNKSNIVRSLPQNVSIVDTLVIDSFRIGHQNIVSILKSTLGLIKEAVTTKHGIRYFISFRHYLYVRLEAEILSNRLKSWLKKTNKMNSLAYFYWSDNSLLAYSLINNKIKPKKAFCRAHRFDLYDDQNLGGLIPFRLTMYNAVDAIYCISNHGVLYLQNALPNKFHHKIKLSYLGVKAPNTPIDMGPQNLPIIVSCARMEVFKRLSLMPEILRLMQSPVHWVHFGDGPEFELVKELTQNLPSHLKVTLKGQVTNAEIHQFYAQTKVNLFISLSLSEGLPVSMMEAISYGIPILSTAVNGTPEIVTPKTGLLISVNETLETMAKKIDDVLINSPFDSESIKAFYFTHFNAENNYRKFAKELAECIS